MDIVIDWGIVTVATVVLAFVVNQVLAWLGLELSSQWKKIVAYLTATGLVVYFALVQGMKFPAYADPAQFIAEVLVIALAISEVANVVYDKIWQGLLKA